MAYKKLKSAFAKWADLQALKGTTMTKNPESRNPNVSQGPRSGNAGTPAKRDRFIEMKSTGTKTALADEVMSALEARNPGGYRDPRVEPLDADRGPKRNPTAGMTLYNKTTRAPRPRPGPGAARIRP